MPCTYTRPSEKQGLIPAAAAAAAIAGAKQLGADHADLLVYATRYDKSPGDNMVGYAGIVF